MSITKGTVAVVYHAEDFDGYCSGAIARAALEDLAYTKEYTGCKVSYGKSWPEPPEAGKLNVLMVPFVYGDRPTAKSLEEFELVYILDASLEPGELMALAEADPRRSIIWIDHHQKNKDKFNSWCIENNKDRPSTLGIVFDNEVAACESAFRYFFPKRATPKTVKLLSLYDTWKHEDNPKVLNFQYGCRSLPWAPLAQADNPSYTKKHNDFWDRMLNTYGYTAESEGLFISGLESRGGVARDMIAAQDQLVSETAFVTEITSPKNPSVVYTAICMNHPLCSSNSFDLIYDPEQHDLMLAFSRNAYGTWDVSLYTTNPKLNCADLASELSTNGGGHAKAAGCQMQDLKFLGL